MIQLRMPLYPVKLLLELSRESWMLWQLHKNTFSSSSGLFFFVFSCKYYPVSSNMTASQKHSRSPPVVNKWKTTQLMVFCWLYEALGYKETKHVYI